MIEKNNKASQLSVKQLKEKDKAAKEVVLREMCEKFAVDKYTENVIKTLREKHKGIWYLPILSEDEDGNEFIEKMAIMKPITRSILSYADAKLSDGGLYDYLEFCMRECMVEGDEEIIEDDECFIPAANKFNAILDGKKAALIKG